MRRILFVCTGNICRSPTVEAVVRNIIKNKKLEDFFEVDSAATHDYHVGEPPDPRSRRAALRRGLDFGERRARRVEPADFERFDLLLAMDRANLAALGRMAPAGLRHKTGLFMRYATRFRAEEMPDPYYGGEEGFELVLDMAEDAGLGLIETLWREWGGRP